MIQIHPNIYLGNDEDVKKTDDSWYVVHACKEPYHRKALGYKGRAPDKSDPEYLYAERGTQLMLNLVDAGDVNYISREVVNKAISWITPKYQFAKVLIHCNEGQSRCCLIGMLFLASIGKLPTDFGSAEQAFIKIYPKYAPNLGVKVFLRNNYSKYRKA